ncbi:RNA polymerase sigma factor [Cyclobacterium jeungdonense]|uniref:Sigma-70 family RNA polymerase sigma factor n=1 Tax=Cyclobacterium jeungdonense TaxID=708087 RepID=A0ABT8C4F0_9BACT|nr:sigma-70 family RNA polymerase sigma factor [Cyclobacterium jeungdonense]MDN3687257.1 sigma-70 family RNA polymerase sigma factor [Cyclobacterium jeungdonense]
MKTKSINQAPRPASCQVPIEKLFIGCLAQNPRTQRELFDRLYPKMMVIAMRYIKDLAAAEDVVLAAFLKVFDRISQFRQNGSFEGWIRRIVINECLMHLEKESHLRRNTDLEKIHVSANQDNPDSSLHWEDLVKTMERLPDGYRKVFELFVLEGLSHEEIGKRLHISEGTSKSQLCRARTQIQRMLHLYSFPN